QRVSFQVALERQVPHLELERRNRRCLGIHLAQPLDEFRNLRQRVGIRSRIAVKNDLALERGCASTAEGDEGTRLRESRIDCKVVGLPDFNLSGVETEFQLIARL